MMMRDQTRAEELRQLLDTEGDSVRANTAVFNEGRYRAVSSLEYYELYKAQARATKETTIAALPELRADLTEAVETNGGHVYLAADAADATDYITSVATDLDVDRVVKSKSMTTEEIELNDAFEVAGMTVTETDLGEFVLQIAGDSPSHLIAPAIHRSRADIARLFNEYFDPPEPLESAEELVKFARDYLLERIVEADLGVTGANFIVAESGSIVLVTSEGNARKCVTTPDHLITVAGVEKLVPSIESLRPFFELIGRSGTGQDLTAYLSVLTPPVASPPIDFDRPGTSNFGGSTADRTFHLVLIDNGRLAMRDDPDLRETLFCIRCGACANSCANFQQVGGHAFGGDTYTGGIGTGWETGIGGPEAAVDFNDLCTGCTRCVPACPVGIDIPWINTVVRNRINRGMDRDRFSWLIDPLLPDDSGANVPLDKRLFGHIDRLAAVASRTTPISNWIIHSTPNRWLLEWIGGIDRRRSLPRFSGTTLVDWNARRPDPTDVEERTPVVLYPDLYTNFVHVERGKAAIRTLEALGCHVLVPKIPESGRAPFSQGMVATAQQRAERVQSSLDAHLVADRPVLVIEPSDLAMLRREYFKILDAESAERISTGTAGLFEFIHDRINQDSTLLDQLAGPDESGFTRVAYHAHCQQRTLGFDGATVSVLDALGYDVMQSTVECCGMAGSFGYKTDYYDLAMAVGSELADEFSDSDHADRIVLASGTSCLEQLDSLIDRHAHHPIELIAPGMR